MLLALFYDRWPGTAWFGEMNSWARPFAWITPTCTNRGCWMTETGGLTITWIKDGDRLNRRVQLGIAISSQMIAQAPREDQMKDSGSAKLVVNPITLLPILTAGYLMQCRPVP